MRRPLLVVTLVLAVGGSSVLAAERRPTEGDPLQSAECQQALESLQVREAAVIAAAHAAPEMPPAAAALQAARRQAARDCLAARADPPTPRSSAPPLALQRFAQPPLAVPPVRASSGALPAAPLPLPLPLPPPAAPGRAERPTFVMSCDVVGCWANDGSRLDRVGPNLWGPRGACTVQGTLLQCL